MKDRTFKILFVFGLFLLIPPASGAGVAFLVFLTLHYFLSKLKEFDEEENSKNNSTDSKQTPPASSDVDFEQFPVKQRPDIQTELDNKDYQKLQKKYK